MQTRDEVEGLHNCLEFSQPLSCLYQAIQTRKNVFYCLIWYTRVILMSITCALTASFAMFSTVFKLRKSATDVFAQKNFLEDIFNSDIC